MDFRLYQAHVWQVTSAHLEQRRTRLLMVAQETFVLLGNTVPLEHLYRSFALLAPIRTRPGIKQSAIVHSANRDSTAEAGAWRNLVDHVILDIIALVGRIPAILKLTGIYGF